MTQPRIQAASQDLEPRGVHVAGREEAMRGGAPERQEQNFVPKGCSKPHHSTSPGAGVRRWTSRAVPLWLARRFRGAWRQAWRRLRWSVRFEPRLSVRIGIGAVPARSARPRDGRCPGAGPGIRLIGPRRPLSSRSHGRRHSTPGRHVSFYRSPTSTARRPADSVRTRA